MRRYGAIDWMKLFVALSLVLGLVAAVPCSSSAAQKYPTRPIELVMGFQPGASDLAIRPFTEKLQELLGQPISYTYKPGSSGAAAASFVAKAKPDGYTLLGATKTPVIVAPLTTKGLGYTLDDLTPVAKVSTSPAILAVRPDLPLKTLKDVIAAAKKSPGSLSYSTSGIFSAPHVRMEMFSRHEGIQFNHIPTQGSGPAVLAILGGHVDMTCATMASISPHLKAGTLRAIAVPEKERLKQFPDVPTFAEAGCPVTFYRGWNAVMAPKRTPPEIVTALYRGLEQVVKNNRAFLEDRIEGLSLVIDFAGLEEFDRENRAELEVMKQLIKDLSAGKK